MKKHLTTMLHEARNAGQDKVVFKNKKSACKAVHKPYKKKYQRDKTIEQMKKLCNLKKEDGTYRLYYTALFDSYQINENTIAKSPCEKALLSEFGYLLNTHKQIAIENDRLKETLGKRRGDRKSTRLNSSH